MKKSLPFLLILLLFSCKSQPPPQPDTKSDKHAPTPLPIMLENLTKKEHAIINMLNANDTSSYLIESRPIIFQIQGVRSKQNQVRYTKRINQTIEVMIYTEFEVEGDSLLDFGWIETEEGEIVWETKFEDSEYAGGDQRNRKVIQQISLAPGIYKLRYNTNESHAVEDWKGAPPEREFYYGITVFNLKAIERIEEAFGE